MKILFNVLIGLITIVSSCTGAAVVTNRRLTSAENRTRLATIKREQLKSDSIALTDSLRRNPKQKPVLPYTDSRDTILYVACNSQFTRKITYHRPITWERVHEKPYRINILIQNDTTGFAIASILGYDCSVARIPL